MNIILNCKTCDNVVYINKINNKYIIECCDNYVNDDEINDCIDKWNDANNIYHHLFGVRFKIDYNKEKMLKVLDTFYVYDSIIIEKTKIAYNLKNDDLFSKYITLNDLYKMFPECHTCSVNIKGMETRKNCHLPNYELYKIISDFKLEDSDVQNLINFWSIEQLNCYKYKKKIIENDK